MKNKLILCVCIALTACSSSSYVTDVKTESYREDYKTQKIEPPMLSDAKSGNQQKEMMTENSVSQKPNTPMSGNEQAAEPAAQKAKPTFIKIQPPTKKQLKAAARFGYTIQVAAVATENKVMHFAAKLPQQVQPIWQNYKIVKGTKWYTVLYGDFATVSDAKAAIKTLSGELQALKPFVKSIDAIKNSNYPVLKKLN